MSNKYNEISLSHGNGGKLSHELINDIFVKIFNNRHLDKQNDSAVVSFEDMRLAFTTDSYVVKPIFFKGGDIGKLAVTGTVNDLAVMGADPMFLSAGFIIEEGFSVKNLERITMSMKKTADEAGVQLVTGDTKVVEKHNADSIFINTSGIGLIKNQKIDFSADKIQPGDQVIINGSIGDHGVAIIEAREDFPIKTSVKSDCASLNGIINNILAKVDPVEIRIMRDPTRGGIATTLNEFVKDKNFSIELKEEKVPIKDQIRSVCEMTGFDPLYLANEGKVIIVCSKNTGAMIMEIMKSHSLGKDACIIGEVTDNSKGNVILDTVVGGKRIIDMLVGNMLPRIC